MQINRLKINSRKEQLQSKGLNSESNILKSKVFNPMSNNPKS
jgi:hypothetical protein